MVTQERRAVHSGQLGSLPSMLDTQLPSVFAIKDNAVSIKTFGRFGSYMMSRESALGTES
jgi:hypothetical protein